MWKDEYNIEMLKLISDESNYKQIDFYSTKKFERIGNKLVKDLKKRQLIGKTQAKRLTSKYTVSKSKWLHEFMA